MEQSVSLAQEMHEHGGMAARVHDAEHLRFGAKAFGDPGVVLGADVGDIHPLQAAVEQRRVRDDLAHLALRTAWDADGELGTTVHGRLRGGAQNHGAPVVLDQLIEGPQAGLQELDREDLGFVKDDHGACEVVQLATG